MNTIRVISGAIIGTSVMTLFSYVVSGITNRQFKEPVLLNQLLRYFRYCKTLKKSSLPGWVLHYLIGTLFLISSNFIWNSTSADPNLKSGALLGLMYGIIGISGWHIIFRLHPNPPSIKLDKYYLHLIVAHIIYGGSAAAGFRLPDPS